MPRSKSKSANHLFVMCIAAQKHPYLTLKIISSYDKFGVDLVFMRTWLKVLLCPHSSKTFVLDTALFCRS